jgi:nitrite reductase/ring-hydroxylating ferredoxin subunit
MAAEDVSQLDSFALRDLPEGKLHARTLTSGKKVVLVRRGDEVKAFGELCPHMGADLAEGWYCEKSGTLQCRWHGYIFGTSDGRFLENPNEKLMKLVRVPSKHYDPAKTPKYRLAVVPCQVDGDRVIVGKRAATQDDADGDHP